MRAESSVSDSEGSGRDYFNFAGISAICALDVSPEPPCTESCYINIFCFLNLCYNIYSTC